MSSRATAADVRVDIVDRVALRISEDSWGRLVSSRRWPRDKQEERDKLSPESHWAQGKIRLQLQDSCGDQVILARTYYKL